MSIRPTRHDDVPALSRVADAAQFCPGEMLPAMIAGFLAGGDGQEIWFPYDREGQPVAFCYAAPEKLTDGTWNMLAIAVHPDFQGKGIGASLVRHLEQVLSSRAKRVLIADTSGSGAFTETRDFYRKNGYTEEARIRDFWAAGDDKVVFWKRLATAPK